MKILPLIFFMAVSVVRGAFAATGSAVGKHANREYQCPPYPPRSRLREC